MKVINESYKHIVKAINESYKHIVKAMNELMKQQSMDHCESFPFVGSSLIISIIKWKMGMGKCMSEERDRRSLEG